MRRTQYSTNTCIHVGEGERKNNTCFIESNININDALHLLHIKIRRCKLELWMYSIATFESFVSFRLSFLFARYILLYLALLLFCSLPTTLHVPLSVPLISESNWKQQQNHQKKNATNAGWLKNIWCVYISYGRVHAWIYTSFSFDAHFNTQRTAKQHPNTFDLYVQGVSDWGDIPKTYYALFYPYRTVGQETRRAPKVTSVRGRDFDKSIPHGRFREGGRGWGYVILYNSYCGITSHGLRKNTQKTGNNLWRSRPPTDIHLGVLR